MPEKAIPHLNRAIELEPRNAGTLARLGAVYEQMGRFDEALALYEKRLEVLGDPGSDDRQIARVYARMGRREKARQMLTRQGNRWPDVHAALGDKDAAFAWLFKSLDERDDWNLYVKTDPPYDGLHEDPRWKELLRRMSLPAH
jgi:tetratricopeptide (TPR) repeat protein